MNKKKQRLEMVDDTDIVLLEPEEYGLAIIKDKHFSNISDSDFRRLLYYYNLLDFDNNITELSFKKGYLQGFLGTLHDGELYVETDRFSPDDEQILVSPKGIDYIRSIIKRTGNEITFGKIMDSQSYKYATA